MEVGEDVWKIVMRWKNFERETLGKQLTRAADSVSANLSEGYGRYHFKDAKNFGYYARGSLYETKTWLTKAFARNLLAAEEFNRFEDKLETIGKMLNTYIRAIGNVSEPDEPYNNLFQDGTTKT